MTAEDPRVLALASYLECEPDELAASDGDETRIIGRGEYLVLTESESEAAMEEKLEQIRQMVPEQESACLTPALIREVSGYGYVLSSHDSDEGVIVVDGVPYFIYRVD